LITIYSSRGSCIKPCGKSLLPVIPEKLIEFQPTGFSFVKEAPPSVLLDADFDVPHVDPIINHIYQVDLPLYSPLDPFTVLEVYLGGTACQCHLLIF
jgi:hypothetical protein